MSAPQDSGGCVMAVDDIDGARSLGLLRELRLALEVHGPTLGSSGSGCSAHVRENDADRRGQGRPTDQGSHCDDNSGPLDDADDASDFGDANGGNSTGATSTPSPDAYTRRREAAESLCDSLRTFVLGWDEQCHQGSGLEERARSNGQPVIDVATDEHCASEINEHQCHSLGGRVVSCLFGAFGPTDGQLRSILLQVLPTLKSNVVRTSLLGWLVQTVPTHSSGSAVEMVYEVDESLKNDNIKNDDGREESNERMSEPVAFDATDEIMNVLRRIIKSDPASLLPVVNCLSSLLPSLTDCHANIVSRICVAGLKVVEAEELPELIRCLFRSIRRIDGCDDDSSNDTDDDGEEASSVLGDSSQQQANSDDADFGRLLGKIGAIQAIQAVRTEWDLIQAEEDSAHDDNGSGPGANSGINGGDDISVLVSIIGVLCESLCDPSTSTGRGPRICQRKGYLSIISDFLDRCDASGHPVSGSTFSVLDVAALIVLFSSTGDDREEIESITDDMYAMGIFPFANSATKLIVSVMTVDAVSKRTKSALRSGLQNLCLHLLLCPLRCRRFPVDVAVSTAFSRQVEGFVSGAFEALSSGDQGWSEFVSSLIDLSFIESTILKRQESSQGNFGVPNVKRSGRSRRADLFLVECAHRVAHSSLKVLENLLATSIYRDVLCQYRQDFVEHLFDSPSPLATAEPALLDLLCGVVASLFINTTEVDIENGGGLVSLIQRLLFVPPQANSISLHRTMNYHERLNSERETLQRMGLCLCRHLVRSQVVSQSQFDTIWSWTMRIMRSQFSPAMNGRPSGEFPPALGLSGLLVLMEGCGIDALASTPNNGENTISAAQEIPSRTPSEVYGMLKTIVARTGLIQLDAKVPAIIQRSNLSYECYYATVSACFASSDEDSSNTRRMAFSIAGYIDSLFGSNISGSKILSVDAIASVPSAATTFQWCYTLLDTYLQLGREASGGKWSPDGWLSSSFILCRFPSDDFSDESTSHPSSDIIKALLHVHGCVAAVAMSAAVLKNAYGQYSALFLSDAADSRTKADALLRLIQHQLSVLYDLRRRCLSAISFIEKSTESLGGKSAGERGRPKKKAPGADQKKRQRDSLDQLRKKRKKKKPKSGGDRLIGNYDASRRIRYLESLNNVDKKDGDDEESKEGEDGIMTEEKDGNRNFDTSQYLSSEESSNGVEIWLSSQCKSIRSFLSDQMSKPNFIPKELLCDCLFYGDDRGTLDKFVDSLVENDDADNYDYDEDAMHELERASLQIIWLRRILSSHLAMLVKEGSVTLSPRSLSALLRMIERLSPILKILRSNGHRRLNDPGCSSNLPVLVSEGAQEDVFAFDVRTLLSSYYDVLTASIGANRCDLAHESGHSESSNGFKSNLTASSLYERLRNLLATCEDGVLACQIIDLVAIVVVQCQDSTMDGIELSWKTLTTVYAGCSVSEVMSPEVSNRLLCPPPAFCRVMQRFAQDSGAKRDVRAALDAFDRFASMSTRIMKENALLRYSFLNQWALVATKSFGSSCDELRKLVYSLRCYVEGMSQDIRASSCSSQSSLRARRAKSNLQAEGKKGKDPHPVGSETDIDLPNLTAKSFPVFYEGLLCGIIASFALAKPGAKPGNDASPFKEIQLLSRLFRDMAEMFTKNAKLFPQRTMGVVVRACAMVVSTCERQVLDCVTWRNKQPFLSRTEGDTDYASSAFLQTLIDNMAFNCAGSAILFCDLVKSQAKQGRPMPNTAKGRSRNDSDDDDDDIYSETTDDEIGVGGEDWAYGSYQKAVASLLLQGEKAIDALRVVCTSYNLRHPRIRMTKSEMREVASRDRLPAKVRDEEKKEMSSSEERPGPDREATRQVTTLSATTVRRKGKRKVAVENMPTFQPEKKTKRRITPALVAVRPQEAERKSIAGPKTVDAEGDSAQDAEKISNGFRSDSEDSAESNDSFGIDGGWG